MSSAVLIALIALVASLASTGLSVYSQFYSARRSERRDAEAVLVKYREPLVDSAYELQSRLFNILELGFLRRYYLDGDEVERRYAVENTLYVVTQYFGWTELLRQEIQYLNFVEVARTRMVAKLQWEVTRLFQSDDPELGRPFRVWRGEQHAIGERMIVTDAGRARCVGYATFAETVVPSLDRWIGRLERDIEEIANTPNPRLRALQHALVDLVRALDPVALRYPDDVLRKI